MPKVELTTTKLLTLNQLTFGKIVVNRGGTRSSKSYSLMQMIILMCFKYKGLQFLIVRKTLPSLRDSILITFYNILSLLKIRHIIGEEKMGLNYYIDGNRIKFSSIDDPEKIKSSEWNYIFMEEANEFSYEDLMILKMRLSAKSPYPKLRNQLFMGLNPVDEHHWIKELLIDPIIDPKTKVNHAPDELQEIHSTYRYNRFLDRDYILQIEALIHQDPNYYRIYGQGEWGRLENLIYSNWAIVDKMPTEFQSEFFGLDFGYNAETALSRHLWDGKEIWEEELIYKTKLTNSDLIAEMDRLMIPKNKNIYADSAEPDRIREIQRAGYLCKPANKDKKMGIDFVKRLKVNILKTSSNLIKEKQSYSYRVDRNKHVLDEPVDFRNHLMDAERYAIFNGVGLQRSKIIRWI